MALQYSPKIVQDGLVMCLDPSQNKSYPTTDLPVKGGLLLWLDASDDSTFSYSSGTEISQWRDKSGNNFHANQSTTAQQPSRSSVLNSRKSVNFTAANGDFMRVSSGIVTPNYITVFAAIKPAAQSNAYAIILEQDHGNGYNGWVIQRNNTTSYWQTWVSTAASNWLNANQIAYTDNTSQIVTLRKNASTINLYSNGTSSSAVSISDTAITQSSYGLNLGYWQYGGGRYYNGEICEILVFNRGLSDTELKQVNTYLGQKWGILNTDRSIIDLSGNNNHGLLGNGTTADMPAADYYNKGALKLDGTSDYIAVANNTSLNPATVTVSIWVKRNGYQSSVANYLRRNYNDAYGILGDIAADNVRFRIHNGSTYPESPNATLSLNEWTNIVGTYDLANIKIYKNGVFVGQTAHTSAISYASSNTTLTIGRDDPVEGRYMNANYGSVLIYSRALSAAEIAQNYEAQKSKFANTIVQQGLVLNLDAGNIYSYAGAGTVWYDVSGNSYNGTLTNSPTYSSDNNGLISFNGSSQYVDCGNVLASLTNLTLECFIKFGTQSTSYNGIISKTLDNTNGWEIRTAGYTSTTTTAQFRYVGDNGSPDFGALTNGVWYHLVATGTLGSQLVYINGSIYNSGTYAGTPSTNSNSLVIGKLAYAGLYANMTMGYTRIYNRVLSAAEVLQNYNATKARFGL